MNCVVHKLQKSKWKCWTSKMEKEKKNQSRIGRWIFFIHQISRGVIVTANPINFIHSQFALTHYKRNICKSQSQTHIHTHTGCVWSKFTPPFLKSVIFCSFIIKTVWKWIKGMNWWRDDAMSIYRVLAQFRSLHIRTVCYVWGPLK